MKKSLFVTCAAVLVWMPTMATADVFLTYSPTSGSTDVTFDGTTLSGSNIPVEVSLFAPNSYGSNPVDAILDFSATAAGPAAVAFGFFYVQPVSNLSFSIIADTPVGGMSNLLSGTANSGDFSGTSAGFSLSAQNQTFNDGIVFTSDFINVADLSNLSFQFNTGPPDSGLSVNGSGVLSSFNTNATPGSVDGIVATPDPASFGLLGTAIVLLITRKQFKRARITRS